MQEPANPNFTPLRIAVVFYDGKQRDIAAAAGIHETYLSKIVNGAAVPGPRTRAKLAAALGKPEADLWPEEQAA